MARDSQPRNCFLDSVPEEVLSQHRRSLEDNAFFYPELVCARKDTSFFTRLREELDFAPKWLDNGMPFCRQMCLGNDSLLNSSPAFRQVIELLVRTFRVEPVRSLVNLYRHGGDWCNLHSDQYDAGHCDINFTIGASFGEERVLLFEAKADRRGAVRGGTDTQRVQIPIVQRNGDVHAFNEAMNKRWLHGVPRSTRAQGERISIMLWGYRGDGAMIPHTVASLPGTLQHILSYDPKNSRTPRLCEACDQTKLQLGGKVDLDHRWCCAECWQEHDALGWWPRAAKDPQGVTDCLTIQGSQLAVAVLAGLKTLEYRKMALPEGWYALHVARRPIDSSEKRRVEEQWPNAPKEDELPHEAVVGVINISRPEAKQPAEDSPWVSPGICHVISAVVALEKTLPARPPGNPMEPWRLSPASQRSVANLIEGQPIYENTAPKLEPVTKAHREAGSAPFSKVETQWQSQEEKVATEEQEVIAAASEIEAVTEAAVSGQAHSWWQAGDWGRGDASSWQSWSASSWVATPWTSSWGKADSAWYYVAPAGANQWQSVESAPAAGTDCVADEGAESVSSATRSAAHKLATEEASSSRAHPASDERSGSHDVDTRRRSWDLDHPDSKEHTSHSRGARDVASRRRNEKDGDDDYAMRIYDSRSDARDADSRRRKYSIDDSEPRHRAAESRSNARHMDSTSGGDAALVERPPGLEEQRDYPGSRANTARSSPPPYAPPAMDRPPPYAPPSLERHSAAQGPGSRPSGQHRNTEAKTFQARTGRAGPRGSATSNDAPAPAPRVAGEKSSASNGGRDPWGSVDPWSMALEQQGRSPSKKSPEAGMRLRDRVIAESEQLKASASPAWRRYQR